MSLRSKNDGSSSKSSIDNTSSITKEDQSSDNNDSQSLISGEKSMSNEENKSEVDKISPSLNNLTDSMSKEESNTIEASSKHTHQYLDQHNTPLEINDDLSNLSPHDLNDNKSVSFNTYVTKRIAKTYHSFYENSLA